MPVDVAVFGHEFSCYLDAVGQTSAHTNEEITQLQRRWFEFP